VKASVYIATTLDGFIARPNGDLDWLPGSQEGESQNNETIAEEYGYQELMDSVDTLVMGRHTYETVLSFGQWSYGTKRVVVLSSTLSQKSDERPKTVEVRSGSPAELIKTLAATGAKHLYIDGGKTIQGFLNAGFIQEIIITRIPILIGKGIRLFGPLNKDVKLQHIETCSYDNGIVQSKYRVLE
jgi:dihydrofolate reductase